MAGATGDGSRGVILVVDDALACAAAIEIAISDDGATNVQLAANGALAWRYLESTDGAGVRAVITDLDMPVMDGFELIRRIRSSAKHAKMPVIVVSACAEQDAAARAIEAGANAFFGKPWSPGRMRAVLERLLYENDASGA